MFRISRGRDRSVGDGIAITDENSQFDFQYCECCGSLAVIMYIHERTDIFGTLTQSGWANQRG
jgi:hypothetical protein